MPQYIVLKSISPHEGPIIEPAQPTPAEPNPAPVLVDETLFSGDTSEERTANIARLIDLGVIAPYEAPALEPEPTDKPARARKAAITSEE